METRNLETPDIAHPERLFDETQDQPAVKPINPLDYETNAARHLSKINESTVSFIPSTKKREL